MIKPKHGLNVKTLLVYVTCLLAILWFAFSVKPWAQEGSAISEKTSLLETNTSDAVNDIEAEDFIVKLTRTSRSGRVLLLADDAENNPYPGKILLLKSGKDVYCAVRVLRVYRNKFAAKNVLPFKDVRVGDEYRALKKIGDKYQQMIDERERRMTDPDGYKTDEELSREVAPDDTELDKGIATPPPSEESSAPNNTQDVDQLSKKDNASKASNDLSQSGQGQQPTPERLFTRDGNEIVKDDMVVNENDESLLDPYIDPFVPLEPTINATSFEFASMLNQDNDGTPKRFNALGIRYSYNFSRYLAFSRKDLQDLLAFEVGAFYYTIAGYQSTGDSVGVLPLSFNLRYTLLVGEHFSPFTYLGILRNNVTSGTLGVNTSRLNNTNLAFGVGAFMRIGPQWALRFDYGLDMLGAGIMLKF